MSFDIRMVSRATLEGLGQALHDSLVAELRTPEKQQARHRYNIYLNEMEEEGRKNYDMMTEYLPDVYKCQEPPKEKRNGESQG